MHPIAMIVGPLCCILAALLVVYADAFSDGNIDRKTK